MTWPPLSPRLAWRALKNSPRLRIMLWALAVCVPMGMVQFLEPLDVGLMVISNRLRAHPASGQIVVAAIDVKSVEALGGYPWSRAVDAKFIDEAFKAGARRVFFDKMFIGRGDRTGDEAFERVLEKYRGRVFLGMLPVPNESGKVETVFSQPSFRNRSKSLSLGVIVGFNGYGSRFFRSVRVNNIQYHSIPAELASRNNDSMQLFRPDYSIKANSIPTIPYVDTVLDHEISKLAGKDVVAGAAALSLHDIHWIPGQGGRPGVYSQVIAAETLKSGAPIDAGFLPGFIIATIVAAAALFMRGHKKRWATLSAGIISVIAMGIVGPLFGCDFDNATALVMLVIVCVRMDGFMRAYRNLATDFPNLNALERDPRAKTETLVSVRIHNYSEIIAQLGKSAQMPLADDILKRLQVLHRDINLYQSDEGSFVFTTPLKIDELADHLEGAYTLLIHPIVVGSRRLDLRLGFGVDDAPADNPLTVRLANIMVAGLHTRGRVKKWLKIDQSFWGTGFDLSVMGELDEAIEHGKLDVVYQPQFDLRTRAVIGFEALARWYHPVRGQIRPDEFIRAAEETRRIAGLTEYVLDRSLETASRLRAMGCVHSVAVNLSSLQLSDDKIVDVATRLLKAHDFPPGQLTLELTETGPIDDKSIAKAVLAKLRALGIRLSIDDFGTGAATLEYFKQVHTDEIKIDKQFIIGILVDPNSEAIVRSAIELARANGRSVVAEGVGSFEMGDRLAAMGCHIGQGFGLSKPVDFDALLEVITGRPRLIHVTRFVPATR